MQLKGVTLGLLLLACLIASSGAYLVLNIDRWPQDPYVPLTLFSILMVVLLLSLGFIWRQMKRESDNHQKLLSLAKSLKNEQLKVDEALKKAEAASEEKSSFLANMSHEIRTPMNGILGMVTLLDNTSLTQVQREYLTIIRSSSEALLTVINDILDFSKIESGKLTITKSVFDLPQLVDHVVQLLKQKAQEKGLELICTIDASVPQYFFGDELRVRQILLNLISNAIKFTSTGFVKVGLVARDLGHDILRLHLEVKDSGIGIPLERQAYMFERFNQADSSITRRFGGTGLGLAICKQLAHLMGGDIGFSSIEGQGSTFWVTLDEKRVRDPAAAQTIQKKTFKIEEATKKYKILVAEDNPVNQLLLKTVLDKQGHTVIMTNNGQECLDQLKDSDFDFILMDAQMPVMDGVTATQEIRTLGNPKAATPIIFLTANAMSGDREKFLEYGGDGYVPKPIDFNQLAQEIEMVLENKLAAE